MSEHQLRMDLEQFLKKLDLIQIIRNRFMIDYSVPQGNWKYDGEKLVNMDPATFGGDNLFHVLLSGKDFEEYEVEQEDGGIKIYANVNNIVYKLYTDNEMMMFQTEPQHT